MTSERPKAKPATLIRFSPRIARIIRTETAKRGWTKKHFLETAVRHLVGMGGVL